MTSFHLLSLLALFACQPRSEPAPDAACEAAAASLQAWLEQLAEEGSAGPIEPPEGLVLVEAEVPWLTKTGLALTATLDTESVTLADMSAPVSEAASVFAAGPERPATLAKPDQGFLLAVDEGTPWAVFDVEEVVYNTDVETYIRARGP